MLKVISLNLIPDLMPWREEFGTVPAGNSAQMTCLVPNIHEHGKINQISQWW